MIAGTLATRLATGDQFTGFDCSYVARITYIAGEQVFWRADIFFGESGPHVTGKRKPQAGDPRFCLDQRVPYISCGPSCSKSNGGSMIRNSSPSMRRPHHWNCSIAICREAIKSANVQNSAILIGSRVVCAADPVGKGRHSGRTSFGASAVSSAQTWRSTDPGRPAPRLIIDRRIDPGSRSFNRHRSVGGRVECLCSARCN
jgi:hypothetical protein